MESLELFLARTNRPEKKKYRLRDHCFPSQKLAFPFRLLYLPLCTYLQVVYLGLDQGHTLMSFARCLSATRTLVMAQMGTCSGRAITDSTKEISSSCFKLAIRKRSTFAVIGQREERAQGILPKATVEAFPSYSTLKSMFRRASFTTSAVHHPPRVRVIRQPPANFKAIDMQLKLQKHANGQVSHQWLLWVLLGINATVFVIWQYADNSSQRYKDPALWIAMYKNFMCSFLNLNEGRWWVLFSACISHSDLQHFAFNMLSLFFMATPVLALIGPSTFLALYFGAGMASCTFSLGWRKYVTPWIYQETWSKQKQSFSMQIGCHGASGESVHNFHFLLSLYSIWT